jgi:excisionase family DNA binding protein
MTGYITTKQLAEKLGVDPSRIRRMILDGLIQAEKAGRDNFITDAEVKRLESLARKTGRPRKKKTDE